MVLGWLPVLLLLHFILLVPISLGLKLHELHGCKTVAVAMSCMHIL